MDLLSESSRAKQLEAEVRSTRSLLEAACEESSAARGEALTLQAELHTVSPGRRACLFAMTFAI